MIAIIVRFTVRTVIALVSSRLATPVAVRELPMLSEPRSPAPYSRAVCPRGAARDASLGAWWPDTRAPTLGAGGRGCNGIRRSGMCAFRAQHRNSSRKRKAQLDITGVRWRFCACALAVGARALLLMRPRRRNADVGNVCVRVRGRRRPNVLFGKKN